MKVKDLKPKVLKYVDRHGLKIKLSKQIHTFEENPIHPSLNTEKIEPKEFGLYSFRIDRKYRAVFHFLSQDTIEIIEVNDHYK